MTEATPYIHATRSHLFSQTARRTDYRPTLDRIYRAGFWRGFGLGMLNGFALYWLVRGVGYIIGKVVL